MAKKKAPAPSRTKKNKGDAKLKALGEALDGSAARSLVSAVRSKKNVAVVTTDRRAVAHLLFAKAPADYFDERSVEQLVAITDGAIAALEQYQKAPSKIVVIPFATPERSSLFVAMTDRPFIVNTMSEHLRRVDCEPRVLLHPILRTEQGQISLSYVEFATLPSARLTTLAQDLEAALSDLAIITDDFSAMLRSSSLLADAINSNQASGDVVEFLRWLNDGAFIFCGVGKWKVKDGRLASAALSELGALKFTGRGRSELMEELRHDATKAINQGRTTPFLIARLRTRSSIQRLQRLMHLAFVEYQDGAPITVTSLCGLFTSKARAQESTSIPVIRQKLHEVTEREGALPNSFDYKNIVNLIDYMPVEESLRLNVGAIRSMVEKSFNSAHNGARVSVHPEESGRGVCILAVVPRERFTTDLQDKLQRCFERAAGAEEGSAEYTLDVSDSDAYRMYFSVSGKANGTLDQAMLDREIEALSRSWKSNVESRLFTSRRYKDVESVWEKYQDAFPDDYQASLSAEEGEHDIAVIEIVSVDAPFQVRMSAATKESEANAFTLVVYHLGSEITISKALPILENVGLEVINERSSRVTPLHQEPVYVHRFLVQPRSSAHMDQKVFDEVVAPGLRQIFEGASINDPLNQLLINAKLSTRAISLLRSYSSLLSQLNKFATRHAIFNVLASNAKVALQIWNLFELRFDPARKASVEERSKQCARGFEDLQDSLREVQDIAQDRILRGVGNLLEHTVRTNFFKNKPYIALKIHSESAEIIPQPKPKFEIFVSSPIVEGVHLRGSMVARGGLRWSDRRDDYRTEVLGLMKTQKIKNTVIVPGGAKGGFIVRAMPDDPAKVKEAVEAAYSEFIRALLSVTDSRKGRAVRHPEGLVIYDGEDPYFVVAADKGTATFSDIANRIAVEEYDFWLGDAFASGGSNGYDHKLYGITAKGTWESVKRHFSELGIAYEKKPFTVVGIGDMSGDVFGNGLILSNQMKLLGAFDHRDIFIDPNPDVTQSFAERTRLFALKGSRWSDYDARLISKGGGIFPRSAKEVRLSKEARIALGVAHDVPEVLTGEQVILQILKAPVDLLWNGGIGTYVKSEEESNADVNDSANDRVRINANELRVRVVGEGGNLGFTQKGRIEFARRGGRVNTDAIDNSGGVDLSDHEVNLKILFADIIKSGRMNLAQRNTLLKAMAHDVTTSVLEDNRGHAIALSLSSTRSVRNIAYYKTLIREVHAKGYISRTLECLPDDDELNDRVTRKEGLFRPELAVCIAGAKMLLKDHILHSGLHKDPSLAPFVLQYFPKRLQEEFEADILKHPLAPNIIATQIVNNLINSAGITYVHRMCINHSASVETVITCEVVAELLLDTRSIRKSIDVFDTTEQNQTFLSLREEISRAVRATASWMIGTHASEAHASKLLQLYKDSYETLLNNADTLLSGDELRIYEDRLTNYRALKLEKRSAKSLAIFPLIIPVLEMLWTARQSRKDIKVVASVFSKVLQTLGVNELVTLGKPFESTDRWEKELRIHSFEEIRRSVAAITCKLLAKGVTDGDRLKAQLVQSSSYENLSNTVRELKEERYSVAALSVVGKQLSLYKL